VIYNFLNSYYTESVFGNLQNVALPPKHIEDYQKFIPETVSELKHLGEKLKGLRLCHVSATSMGGGVSEILHSMVPLQNDIGIQTTWYVLPGDEAFFMVTKNIHNFMQGKEGNLSDEEKQIYLSYNDELADQIAQIEADILIIHDPQPAASIEKLKKVPHRFKKILWRCHMDTSDPNRSVWDFLFPYLSAYDHVIFSLEEFSQHAFPKEKMSIITPGIDPLTEKNIPMNRTEALEYIKRVGIKVDDPYIVQVSRFDPWKDPLGLINVFRNVKEVFPKLQLVFIGQIASDDPEGEEVLRKMKEAIGEEKDIFIFTDFDVKGVNAFQQNAFVVFQKSIKEGFGLTVTEAMWKKKVVIGGNTGGIRLQIQDGVNGYLVNSIEEASATLSQLLSNPSPMQRISKSAYESVRTHHLMPHKIRDYFKLFESFHLHTS